MTDQYNNLNASVNIYLRVAEHINKELLPTLKDKATPLTLRWQLFEKVSGRGLLNVDSCSDGNILLLSNDLTLYDDFNIDRGHTFSFKKMYDRIVKIKEQSPDEIPDENIEKWQEAVLAGGYDSFTYDW